MSKLFFLCCYYLLEWVLHCMAHQEPCHSSTNKQTILLAGRSFFIESIGINKSQKKYIAALSAVFPPTLFLSNKAALFKVGKCTLHRTAGQLQFSHDGANRGKAFAVLIAPVAKIHVYGHCPVRQFGGLYVSKISHNATSYSIRTGYFL